MSLEPREVPFGYHDCANKHRTAQIFHGPGQLVTVVLFDGALIGTIALSTHPTMLVQAMRTVGAPKPGAPTCYPGWDSFNSGDLRLDLRRAVAFICDHKLSEASEAYLEIHVTEAFALLTSVAADEVSS